MDVVGMVGTRGRLIAIEGIDQAGKRTQANLLAVSIRKLRIPVTVWNFPDYTTPLGKQLKAYLRGSVRLDVHSIHLLYAANKWEVAGELTRRIRGGGVVIVNRYTPSNIAYGVAHGLPAKWLESLEDGLMKPDLVLVLDVGPRTSLLRKTRGRDVHESNLTYLNKVRRAYLSLAKKYGWRIVDGQGDAEKVRRSIWREIIMMPPMSRCGHWERL
jgi:dTMP kinase